MFLYVSHLRKETFDVVTGIHSECGSNLASKRTTWVIRQQWGSIGSQTSIQPCLVVKLRL